MKKIISILLVVAMLCSLSVAALAEGVKPATGDSPITVSDVTVKGRTVTFTYSNDAFTTSHDVTFIFYKPDENDNIVDANIYYADQVDAVGTTGTITFTLDANLEEGDYALLVGGTDVDVPCYTDVALSTAVVYGKLTEGDGAVSSADLLLLAKYLAKFQAEVNMFNANPMLKLAADVTHDDNVNSSDLLKLAKYLAKFPNIELDTTVGN